MTLAEELNFRRAAERLGVSQSNLSGQIKRLEDEVGARLFDRTTRHVRMTEAGIRVMPHIRSVLSQAKQVAVSARLEDDKTTASIMIGDESHAFSDGTARKLMLHVPKDVARSLRVRPCPAKGWISGLLDGRADVIFLNRPPKNQPALKCELVSHCALSIVAPNQHPLAKISKITPALLKGESVIIPTENRIGASCQALKAFVQSQGYVDMIDGDHDWSMTLEMVRCEVALGIVPETLWDRVGGDLALLHLENGPSLTHYMAWRSDEERGYVIEFIEYILESQAIARH